jgi:preprotein translocase subunit SecD
MVAAAVGWTYARYVAGEGAERIALVYAVDETKKLPDHFKAEDLTAAIKRRIDSFDLLDATVRSLDPAHVEIVLVEKRHSSPDEIRQIKELITRPGILEFRIVANETDDRDAIVAAEEFFKGAGKDPARKAELDRLALNGEPPPPPQPTGNVPFTVTLRGETSQHTYRWVELGKEEVHFLDLENEAEIDEIDKIDIDWLKQEHRKKIIEARDKGEAVLLSRSATLLYGRAVPNKERLTPAERAAGKEYEYFYLTRDPEPGKEITGGFLERALEGPRTRGRGWAVHFRFNEEGANRFHDLTSRNQPDRNAEFHRQLAIVLDGQIQSAPILHGPIRRDGIIEGDFTREKVQTLVGILRAGALPVTFKPEPVSEDSLGPAQAENVVLKGVLCGSLTFLTLTALTVVYFCFVHPRMLSSGIPGNLPNEEALKALKAAPAKEGGTEAFTTDPPRGL